VKEKSSYAEGGSLRGQLISREISPAKGVEGDRLLAQEDGLRSGGGGVNSMWGLGSCGGTYSADKFDIRGWSAWVGRILSFARVLLGTKLHGGGKNRTGEKRCRRRQAREDPLGF